MLLAFVASFSVPVAQFEAVRVSQGIVWVDNSRRAERNIAETRGKRHWGSQSPMALPACSSTRAIAVFDRSLFQRPPPHTFLHS
jgi:hypothetical protein